MVATHKELAAKLAELERTVADQDGHIKALFQAVRQLMTPPEPNKRKIGFSGEGARSAVRKRVKPSFPRFRNSEKVEVSSGYY